MDTDSIIAGLQSFADDLAAGRLEKYRDRITTVEVLDEPCPACGAWLARSTRGGRAKKVCTNLECRSWVL